MHPVIRRIETKNRFSTECIGHKSRAIIGIRLCGVVVVSAFIPPLAHFSRSQGDGGSVSCVKPKELGD